MPMPDDRRIVLDATTPEQDRDWQAEEHMALFDHWPEPDATGRCRHPVHDELRRLIEGPGVEAEVLFDPALVVAFDERHVVEGDRRYDAEVMTWKDKIALIEERQQYLDALDPKRPLRRAERRRLQREKAKIDRKLGLLP